MTARKSAAPRKSEAEVIREAARETADRLLREHGPLPDSLLTQIRAANARRRANRPA